jgi:glycosyltransferase involved in cell wall biosynthesis
MPRNILFLTPYPNNQAPSQRFRFEQYFDVFRQNDLSITQQSFLDDSTWKIFYKKGVLHKKVWGIFKGIMRRHLIMFKLHKFDVIFIHREACFIGPAYFEWIYSKVFRKKIIFDFDDAIWLRDVSEANNKLAWLKRSEKTSTIISYSTATIAGNKYLADYASNFSKQVTVIPTTIDLSYHYAKASENHKVVIGWTGSVTTNRHFEMFVPILKKLASKYPNQLDFRTISNKETLHEGILVNYIKWSKENEIADLAQFDIGIMPLPNDEWAKGKCGFKGLQYMSLGIPTVMSPVGVNTEIIQDGKNGFLANNESEWIDKLSKLIESKALCKELGLAGRHTIIEKYSVEANKQKYLNLFSNLMNH